MVIAGRAGRRTGAAQAAARAAATPVPQVLNLPAELTNICEADPQALQQAIARHWTPSLASIDQWTQLVRSFSCDLSGSARPGLAPRAAAHL